MTLLSGAIIVGVAALLLSCTIYARGLYRRHLCKRELASARAAARAGLWDEAFRHIICAIDMWDFAVWRHGRKADYDDVDLLVKISELGTWIEEQLHGGGSFGKLHQKAGAELQTQQQLKKDRVTARWSLPLIDAVNEVKKEVSMVRR